VYRKLAPALALLLTVLRRWCVKIHATMQIALRETFEEPGDHF